MTNLKIVTGELNNEGTLVEPIYWCDFSISLNDKKVNTTLQYDCADNWIFYDDSIESILEQLDIKDSAEYEEVEKHIKKALEASEPSPDKEEIMKDFFGDSFCSKYNDVLHGYYRDTSIQVYQLSDSSVMVSVSDYLDPKALFISLSNYEAYLKLLHSDEIWGDALNPAQFAITDRLNDYIDNNQ